MIAVYYLIGEPGAGKSTLMAQVLAKHRSEIRSKPFAHMALGDPAKPWGIELGKVRESFSGTDALSMGVLPKVVEWLPTAPAPIVIGEGDRLTARSFFEACRQIGTLRVIHLDTPPDEAARRRAKRGSTQNDTWVRGRATKVANLARDFATDRIDGSLPIAEKAEALRAIIGVPGL